MSRLALLLALLLAVPAAAQTAHVRVEAEAGEVWVDGDRVGRAGEWVEAAPGVRDLTLVEDSQTWDPRRAQTQVTLATGDSLVVRIALPVRLRVETLPIRATIVRQGPEGLDTLGLAPLTLDADAGESVVLVASLDGYESVRQSVEAGQARVTLVLPLLEDALEHNASLVSVNGVEPAAAYCKRNAAGYAKMSAAVVCWLCITRLAPPKGITADTGLIIARHVHATRGQRCWIANTI